MLIYFTLWNIEFFLQTCMVFRIFAQFPKRKKKQILEILSFFEQFFLKSLLPLFIPHECESDKNGALWRCWWKTRSDWSETRDVTQLHRMKEPTTHSYQKRLTKLILSYTFSHLSIPHVGNGERRVHFICATCNIVFIIVCVFYDVCWMFRSIDDSSRWIYAWHADWKKSASQNGLYFKMVCMTISRFSICFQQHNEWVIQFVRVDIKWRCALVTQQKVTCVYFSIFTSFSTFVSLFLCVFAIIEYVRALFSVTDT